MFQHGPDWYLTTVGDIHGGVLNADNQDAWKGFFRAFARLWARLQGDGGGDIDGGYEANCVYRPWWETNPQHKGEQQAKDALQETLECLWAALLLSTNVLDFIPVELMKAGLRHYKGLRAGKKNREWDNSLANMLNGRISPGQGDPE